MVLIVCSLAACTSTPGRWDTFDRVMSTAVSADGRTLAASTVLEEVAVFDLSPLRLRSVLTSEKVYKQEWYKSPPLAFSPDGRLLVGAGVSGHLVGWEVDSGRVRFRAPLAAAVEDVAFDPDGRSFLTVGPAIDRFSAEDGRLLSQLSAPGAAAASAIAVSPDGKHLLAGLSTGEIAQYDAEAGRLVRTVKGHAVPVTGVAVAPDGVSVASTAGLFDPKFWNLEDDPPTPLGLLELEQIRASRDQSMKESSQAYERATWAVSLLSILVFAAALSAGVPVTGLVAPPIGWEHPTTATTQSSLCHSRIVYSPDGRYVATSSPAPSLTTEFRVVVADLGQKRAYIIGGIYGCSVAFSRDSRFLITGGPGAPQIWNAETGQQVDSAR
jgi:WD40 repeat protein